MFCTNMKNHYHFFNSKTGFPKLPQHAFFKDFISIKDFPYRIGLPEGEYAISLFHDENENKELDTNFIGIPKEAFGSTII